jgi:hypothetical protein
MQAGGTEQPFEQEQDMTMETNTATAAGTPKAAFDAGSARTSAYIEQTRSQLIEAGETAARNTAEIIKFSQGNFDALRKSGQIWAAGLQDLSKQAAASFQASFQATSDAFRTLGSAGSLTQAIELQTSSAREILVNLANNGTRLTEATLNLAKQASTPLTERISLAGEAFTKAR